MNLVRRGVRTRITLIATAAVAIVLVAVGAALLAVQTAQLTADLDASLARRADAIELSVGGDTSPGETVLIPSSAGDDALVQVVSPSGVVVAATSNAAGIAPVVEPPAGSDDVVVRVDSLPIEDDRYRVLSRRLDDGTVIHVAENTDDRDDVVRRLRTAIWWIVPGAVAVLAAVVWWLVGRTLRPVDAIREEVDEIGAARLDRRVPVPETDDEISRLATTMNEMLARLQDSSTREQRFVADASHELRSPLARMRAELDADHLDDAAIGRLGGDVDRMAALVSDLLVLARVDAGNAEPERRPLDLDDLVFAEVAAKRERVDVEIDVSQVSGAHLEGDPGQLRRVVRNLLDNACRHAGSRVAVEVAERSDDGRAGTVAVLSVTDDGPGVPPERADEVFERFVRLDGARSHDDSGAGLGLAIVREIVTRHGGSVRLDTDHVGGARFVVVLPAVDDGSASPLGAASEPRPS